MTLRELLEKKADQQQYKNLRARQEEWVAAVDRLIGKMRTWLGEADPKGVLDLAPIEIQRSEPGLGTYKIRKLKINLGEAAVLVEPVGRNVVGVVGGQGGAEFRAEGRVDITDGIRRYILYRTLTEGQETWYALDQQFCAAPLDRERLEGILQDLLS